TYYPQWGAIKYSLYNWDGQEIKEYIGLKNFREALVTDQLFWQSFTLVGILLVANMVKMWPSIFTAIALHRIRSERWQYVYRVLFVIPMIIPGLVTLLVWKTFFDSTTGVINLFLNKTGLMAVLNSLDYAMPKVAASLAPAVSLADVAFGSVWGLALLGVMLISVPARASEWAKHWVWWAILTVVAALVWYAEPWRLLVAFAVVGGAVAVAAASGRPVARTLGVVAVGIASVLVLFGMIWTTPTTAFATGAPAWLGHSKLVIPSLVFWGFPWVGTVGVLIYLAGLQNISNDVYEAADLDGLSSFGKLWSLELPLILTQVRINLIFMTIGTLTDYGLIFLLLGANGGPSNVGMVPGLYMYKQAFVDGRFGYSCALGMVLFVLILGITVFYQKYVKVDK
ncbi:MAG TPA: sugar ABC transporter permease, partial [Tepidisphaeraceae bacterium]|nr:sugar ABC transporter permease [Tepidisphaeraceae bacterium]